jgi:hypothetical protein
MPPTRPKQLAQQARRRIERIRAALAKIDYLCSGTLLERTKVCGKPTCRCAQDPAARHGPYYEWGHMKAGKLVRRQVSAEQAQLLRLAIENYRYAQQLLRDWEAETEQLIDAELPRSR